MKNTAVLKLLAMMGMGSKMKAPQDSKDVQDNHEGATTPLPFYFMHQPIHPLSRSQKVKSKRLIASNRKQGRAA